MKVGETHDVIIHVNHSIQLGLTCVPNTYQVHNAPIFISRLSTGDVRGIDQGRWKSWVQDSFIGGANQPAYNEAVGNNRFADSEALVNRDLKGFAGLSHRVKFQNHTSETVSLHKQFTNAAKMFISQFSNRPVVFHHHGFFLFTSVLDPDPFQGASNAYQGNVRGKWVTVIGSYTYPTTSVVNFSGVLFRANPGASIINAYDGTNYSPTLSTAATLLSVYDGKLWRSYKGKAAAYNPATALWTTYYEVGDGNVPITNIAPAFGNLYFGKEDCLYVFESDKIYEVGDFRSHKDPGNFSLLLEHRGYLYFNIRHMLYRMSSGSIFERIPFPAFPGTITGGTSVGNEVYILTTNYFNQEATVYRYDPEYGGVLKVFDSAKDAFGWEKTPARSRGPSGIGTAAGHLIFGPTPVELSATYLNSANLAPIVLQDVVTDPQYLSEPTYEEDAELILSMTDMALPHYPKLFNRVLVSGILGESGNTFEVESVLNPSGPSLLGFNRIYNFSNYDSLVTTSYGTQIMQRSDAFQILFSRPPQQLIANLSEIWYATNECTNARILISDEDPRMMHGSSVSTATLGSTPGVGEGELTSESPKLTGTSFSSSSTIAADIDYEIGSMAIWFKLDPAYNTFPFFDAHPMALMYLRARDAANKLYRIQVYIDDNGMLYLNHSIKSVSKTSNYDISNLADADPLWFTRWHVCSWDWDVSGNQHLYLDGVLLDTDAMTSTTADTPLTKVGANIGGSNDVSWSGFWGQVAFFTISDTVWTSDAHADLADITSNFQSILLDRYSPTYLFPMSRSSPTGWYKAYCVITDLYYSHVTAASADPIKSNSEDYCLDVSSGDYLFYKASEDLNRGLSGYATDVLDLYDTHYYDQFTLMAFIKHTGTAGIMNYVSLDIFGSTKVGLGSLSQSIGLGVDTSGDPCYLLKTLSHPDINVGLGSVDTGWHQLAVACEWTGGALDLRAYRDGISRAFVSGYSDRIYSLGWASLIAGARNYLVPERYADGQIAHVALWNTVLSSLDVLHIHTNRLGNLEQAIKYVKPESLLAYWPMGDETIGGVTPSFPESKSDNLGWIEVPHGDRTNGLEEDGLVSLTVPDLPLVPDLTSSTYKVQWIRTNSGSGTVRIDSVKTFEDYSSFNWSSLGTYTALPEDAYVHRQVAFPFEDNVVGRQVMVRIKSTGSEDAPNLITKLEIEYVPQPSPLRVINFAARARDGIKLLDGAVENSASFIQQTLMSLSESGLLYVVQLPWPPPVAHTMKAMVSVGDVPTTIPILNYVDTSSWTNMIVRLDQMRSDNVPGLGDSVERTTG